MFRHKMLKTALTFLVSGELEGILARNRNRNRNRNQG